jgi:hypothetical protein
MSKSSVQQEAVKAAVDIVGIFREGQEDPTGLCLAAGLSFETTPDRVARYPFTPPGNISKPETRAKWLAEERARFDPRGMADPPEEYLHLATGGCFYLGVMGGNKAADVAKFTAMDAVVFSAVVGLWIDGDGIIFARGGWPRVRAASCLALDNGHLPPLSAMRSLNTEIGQIVPGVYDPMAVWLGGKPTPSASLCVCSAIAGMQPYDGIPGGTPPVRAGHECRVVADLIRALHLDSECQFEIQKRT